MTSDKKQPALLLLPNVLGDIPHHELYLPASVDRAVQTIDGLIAESEKGGRRFLSRFKLEKKPHEIPIALLNEHTKPDEYNFLLEPIRKGERWGLISDAGLPCIADPGALLVQYARRTGIYIQAFSGPSSIFLALMLSGLPGQKFAFQGYLPKQSDDCAKEVQKLERRSMQEKTTQIFIEVPYRNKQVLETFLNTLGSNTILACAWDLTLPTQGVLSQSIELWKKSPLPNLEKKNAVFLFSTG